MENMARKTHQEFGKVDILVNNAIIGPMGPVLELKEKDWMHSMHVNFMGAVHGIRLFLPNMIKQKKGVIASCISAERMPYTAPYSASKAALNSLTQSIASEVGEDSGVCFFSFLPGVVDTPGFAEAAQYIAPKVGMSVEQFRSQSLNPSYEGLLPVDHSAAGFALAILNARQFHGQTTDPFHFLEQYQQLP